MQLVIADTGPTNYLILIGDEAPPAVKDWIGAPPSWVEIRHTHHVHELAMEKLDAGEEAAIALAIELHADLFVDGRPRWCESSAA